MRTALLVAWIGLLMGSRMDFLVGEGPFVLTPFLVLSPIILALEGSRLWMSNEPLRLRTGTTPYFLTITALFVVLLASTFLSYELAVAAGRLALLVTQAYAVFLVVLVLVNRPDYEAVLLKGAYFGLIATTVWNVVQLGVFILDPGWARSAQDYIDLRAGDYFGVVPRLTGVSHDPNHGGLFALFLLWLVATLAPRSRARSVFLTLGVLALLATLSRSAALAGMALWLTTALAGREARITPGVFGLGAAASALAVLTYVAVPEVVERLGDVGSVLGNRFSLEETSSSEHARLIALGWEVATENLRHLALGIGFGNAFVETQEIFPGNDYGNFHNLFVTLLVEGGVVAAGLGIWLFLQALRGAAAVRPIIVALLVFNLFQQAHTEPILWLCLMLAWTTPPGGEPARPAKALDAREPAPVTAA